MRASSYSSFSSAPAYTAASNTIPQQSNPSQIFAPFSSHVFSRAIERHVPVFLLIGDVTDAFYDPSVCAQLTERTVPAQLLPGQRPDVELLCQRAAALFSGEGALPLCALLLENGQPFLAAPLPPPGFPVDPSRLFIWLTHADRRFVQNRAAFSRQAADVLRSFSVPALNKPYTPHDAAHDLLRAILAVQDDLNGGFGKIKAPNIPLLRFLSRESVHGSKDAHAARSKALAAMKAGALYDPVDGLFFRTTLTQDWRVFVPEKPLAVNALIALTLMESGERSEAVRLLDALIERFALPGGCFASALRADKSRYAFTAEQVCAALGDEEGLRACRLLGLLHQRRESDPPISPSRFSPMPPKSVRRAPLDAPPVPLYPALSKDISSEDEAFLRRALSILSRARSARAAEMPVKPFLTMDCALAAAVLATCGQRLGETRYIQSVQQTVHTLLNLIPDPGNPSALAPTSVPALLHSPPTCGAAAALSLALLTLAKDEPEGACAAAGLRLLGSTLHTFTRQDGMVMHTPPDPAAIFPRVPAIFDNELPSPAALLVHALNKAQALRPETPYRDAIVSIFAAAAPSIRHEPLACASLIDAAAAER